MDEEVSQILKKWNMNSPSPRKGFENLNPINHHHHHHPNNESFDSRTFTRKTTRKPFVNEESEPGVSVTVINVLSVVS